MAGWGRKGEREATPSMHDPYVREVKGSLALDAETSEGRTEPRLAGRSGLVRSRDQPRCASRSLQTHRPAGAAQSGFAARRST